MGWICQESEKTKMSSGDFVGSGIIVGYSEGEWGEGELAGRAGRWVKRREKVAVRKGAVIRTDRKSWKCWLGSSN